MGESEAEKLAKARYKKAKRKQIVLNLSHDDFDAITSYCEKRGEQKATMIKRVVFAHIGHKSNDKETE